MPLTHSLTPITSSELTTDSVAELIELSLALAASIPSTLPAPHPAAPKVSWALHKSSADSQLYKAQYCKQPWLARVSVVGDISYEALRAALLTEKRETELAALLTPQDAIELVGTHAWADGAASCGEFRLRGFAPVPVPNCSRCA